MKTSDLFFDLPQALIAQEPPVERGQSRLMVAHRTAGTVIHGAIADLPQHVRPGSVMVFNDSRVRRARVFATAVDSGTRREFLLVAPRNPGGDRMRWLVIGPNMRKLRVGRVFRFSPGDLSATVTAVEEPYRELLFSRPITEEWLERYGHIPLPPYIQREDSPEDAHRYQTVYARATGSVAAPTAGLHFTDALLEELRERGIVVCFVTLHVGIGTFLPVRTKELEDHVMHREEYSITAETAQTVNAAKREGRPILAVGTTAVRTLESAAAENRAEISAGRRDTGIFIYPGYRFRIVDQLFTNFHTPGSTLLALVSAFAGRDAILHWYQEAITQRYRFFSYGDAMLIQ